jgi:hypothetical protein
MRFFVVSAYAARRVDTIFVFVFIAGQNVIAVQPAAKIDIRAAF